MSEKNLFCCKGKLVPYEKPSNKVVAELWALAGAGFYHLSILSLVMAMLIVHRNSQTDPFVDLPACLWF